MSTSKLVPSLKLPIGRWVYDGSAGWLGRMPTRPSINSLIDSLGRAAGRVKMYVIHLDHHLSTVGIN